MSKQVVYCGECYRIFRNYQDVGQAIKDRVEDVAVEAGIEAITSYLCFGPVGPIIVGFNRWETALDAPRAWKAYSGSRRDALNAAEYPCPTCREFRKWKRDDADKSKYKGEFTVKIARG